MDANSDGKVRCRLLSHEPGSKTRLGLVARQSALLCYAAPTRRTHPRRTPRLQCLTLILISLQVTFDELCNFFRLVGAEMSDDDFSLIVEEMIDSAASKSLIKTLQAQGQ